MSLILSELRLRRTSLVIWAIAVALLVLMIVALYPSISGDPALDSLYEGLSPAAQQLLGGSDATSPVGYLSTQLFSFFLPAVLLVFVLGRSAATLAGEEEDRTLDLLLAQPLARWAAYAQKAAAVSVSLFVLSAAALIPLLIFNSPVGLNLPIGNLFAIVTQMFLFCLALGMWTQAISSATGRRTLGLSVVIGYTVVSYLIYGLASSVSWMEHLVPVTLWRWYLGNNPLENGFGLVECGVLVATAGVAIGVGGLFFNKRDLHS
jgi:ABC-2 type transport system permease protein